MRRMALGVAVLALSACATGGGQKEAKVAEADMGRIPADQMGPVDQARQFAASATDEEARAQLRLTQAQHEVDIAKADQESAKADAEQAQAQQKIADDSREPAAVEKAQRLQHQAALHKQAADAHLDYATKLVDARKESVDAAKKQVDLANAKLELAKLQALQQDQVPAAQKYDMAKFQASVSDRQSAFDKAMDKVRDANGKSTGAQQRFESLHQQFQAAQASGVNAG